MDVIYILFRPNFNGTSKGVGETLARPCMPSSQMLINEMRRTRSWFLYIILIFDKIDWFLKLIIIIINYVVIRRAGKNSDSNFTETIKQKLCWLWKHFSIMYIIFYQGASLDFGVFTCSNCSGAHRALGPTVTRVKSTKLDRW